LVLETLSSEDSEEAGEDFTAQVSALVILSLVVLEEDLDSVTHFLEVSMEGLVVSTGLDLVILSLEDLEVFMEEIALPTLIEVTQDRGTYLEVIMLTIGQIFHEQIQIDQDLM
jgi:hypothetical protein